MNSKISFLLAITTLAHPPLLLGGEVSRRGGGDGAQTALLRQALIERDAARTELQTAKEEYTAREEAHKKQLKSLNERIAEIQKKSGDQAVQGEKTIESFKEKLKDQQEKTQKLVDKFKEVVETMRKIESDRSDLQTTAALKTRQFDTCNTYNQKLYEAGLELLERYRNKDFLELIFENEPITQIKKVELENLVQSYRQRLDDAHSDDALAKGN